MTGNKVNAARLELNILKAINIPKYCNGTIFEKTRTKNPTETEMTLIMMAFPLMIIESEIAA